LENHNKASEIRSQPMMPDDQKNNDLLTTVLLSRIVDRKHAGNAPQHAM
jgi:hypothetical protein